MIRITSLTLLSDIIASLAMMIFFTFSEGWQMGLYAGIMTPGILLLPTLIAVLIYQLIKNSTVFKNKTIIIQSFFLFGLFIAGLFIWVTLEAILFSENIIAVFNSEFSGFLPAVFVEAFFIPKIDLWLIKQTTIKTLNT